MAAISGSPGPTRHRSARILVNTVAKRPTGRYYEEFEVGETWDTKRRTITEADIVNFAGFSGDFHPLHTDEEYCKTTQFKTRIFHGPGAFAIATGLEVSLGLKEGTAIAFMGMTWSIRAPIFPGDTMFVRETVKSKRLSSKPGRGVLTFDVKILNQREEVCQEGDWVLVFHCRPAD